MSKDIIDSFVEELKDKEEEEIVIRSSAYYRHQRHRVINRKKKIVKQVHPMSYTPYRVEDSDYSYLKIPGRLSKGKIHCSCSMCSAKSKSELKVSDKRKLDRDKDKIKEYEERIELY